MTDDPFPPADIGFHQGTPVVPGAFCLNGSNGAFVTPSGGLRGPTGLLIAGPQLIVVNQNVNLPIGGEISQYQLVV